MHKAGCNQIGSFLRFLWLGIEDQPNARLFGFPGSGTSRQVLSVNDG